MFVNDNKHDIGKRMFETVQKLLETAKTPHGNGMVEAILDFAT